MRPDQVLNMCATRMLTLLVACLMLVPSSASASFRNALEAYANRDVVAMHAEIDAALQHDNYDGLILFTTAVRLDFARHPSTSWMEQTQREALFKKLSAAAQRSDISSLRYQDLFYNKITTLGDKIPAAFEALARNNYPYASHFLSRHYLSNHYNQKSYEKSLYWLEQAAGQGLAIAQFQMAGIYLRLESLDQVIPIHRYYAYLPEDKSLGIAWLKKAAASYDHGKAMFDDDGFNLSIMRFFASEMMQLFADKNNAYFYDLKEAYRWLILAEQSPGNYSILSAKRLIRKDQESRSQLEKLHQPREASLPTWIEESRHDSAASVPLFTFKLSRTEYGKPLATQYWLDLYPDGRVFMGIPFWDDSTYNRELLLQISPRRVKQFISELKSIGFADWPATSVPVQCITDDPAAYACPFKKVFAVLNEDKQQSQVFMQHSAHDARDQLRIQRIEALNSLVIKYFDHTAIRLIARD